MDLMPILFRLSWLLVPLFWILIGVILYFIIKLAVKNGINESNLFKSDQQKNSEEEADP